MASQGYYDWLAAGKPYTLARPALDMVNVLRAAGYTVYHYPDDAHLIAVPPQDHTPFSATGWPIPSARWVGHALDVMPTPGAPALPGLARQIISDTDRKVPGTGWIKYLNWTDEAGVCRHENWQNLDRTRVTTSSTDKGHIHISARSDMDTWDGVARSGYSPVGGQTDMTPQQGYVLHVINYRVDALLHNRGSVSVPAYIASTGEKFPAISEGNQLHDRLESIAAAVDPGAIAAAVAAAIIAQPGFVDAVVTGVTARIGMIPTAGEIARAVGALDWRARAEG